MNSDCQSFDLHISKQCHSLNMIDKLQHYHHHRHPFTLLGAIVTFHLFRQVVPVSNPQWTRESIIYRKLFL